MQGTGASVAANNSSPDSAARHDCINSDRIYYRSIVDVDLVDTWDLPLKVSKKAHVNCRPEP